MEKRDQILCAANELFERQGFNATGVDQLAAASGVTKRTLYKQFGSKEGLIEEVLKKHHHEMMEQTRAEALAKRAGSQARLMTCFERYRTWFSNKNFSGCIFIKTLNEFGNCSNQLSKIAADSKNEMRDFFVELAKDAGARRPEKLADQIQILLEGSIVVAQTGKGPEVIDTAKAMAKDLIKKAVA